MLYQRLDVEQIETFVGLAIDEQQVTVMELYGKDGLVHSVLIIMPAKDGIATANMLQSLGMRCGAEIIDNRERNN